MKIYLRPDPRAGLEWWKGIKVPRILVTAGGEGYLFEPAGSWR